jgi:hypothetical protein
MMQFMPLIMGFFFYGLSSGPVLYWLTGNIVGIAAVVHQPSSRAGLGDRAAQRKV